MGCSFSTTASPEAETFSSAAVESGPQVALESINPLVAATTEVLQDMAAVRAVQKHTACAAAAHDTAWELLTETQHALKAQSAAHHRKGVLNHGEASTVQTMQLLATDVGVEVERAAIAEAKLKALRAQATLRIQALLRGRAVRERNASTAEQERRAALELAASAAAAANQKTMEVAAAAQASEPVISPFTASATYETRNPSSSPVQCPTMGEFSVNQLKLLTVLPMCR